jgi:hypothetical protein
MIIQYARELQAAVIIMLNYRQYKILATKQLSCYRRNVLDCTQLLWYC